MSTVELRQQAKSLIDGMTPAQLRAASAVLALVKSQKGNAATLELLSIPGFTASYARGLRDIKAGRTRDWRKVRRDV